MSCDGPIGDLEEISIFLSGHEVVFADTEKLRKRFKEKKIPVDYYIIPKMINCWPIFGVSEG